MTRCTEPASGGDDEVAQVARELYRGEPGDFVAARKRAASDAGGETAARIARLPKPAAAARIVNVAVLSDPGVLDDLLDVAARLRDAADEGDAAALRSLGSERRRVVSATTDRAIGRASGSVSGSTRDSVEATSGC